MPLSSSRAAPVLGVVRKLMAWLPGIAFGLASGCTDPTFTETDASDEAESSPSSSDERRTERGEVSDSGAQQSDARDDPSDSGSKSPDGGGPSPTSEECEGGACRTLEAGLPSTSRDGSAASAMSDAGVVLDEVRANWAGRYAARSAMFAYDVPLDGTARSLSTIEIVPTPEGGLRLDEEMCDYDGAWTAGFSATVKYRHHGERASAALIYDSGGSAANSWSSASVTGRRPLAVAQAPACRGNRSSLAIEHL